MAALDAERYLESVHDAIASRSRSRRLIDPEGPVPSGTEPAPVPDRPAYDRMSWHGTNLRARFEACLRAGPRGGRARPSQHLGAGRAQRTGNTWRGADSHPPLAVRFRLEGSNWFARPEQVTPKAWRHDIALLEQTHRRCGPPLPISAADLDRAPTRSKVTMQALVTGG